MEANAPRTLCPGESFRTPGVLVTCEPGAGPLRGLRVGVAGDALARGLVEVTRVRARPFSARLAPWEASGWEHGLALDPRDGQWGCVLRAARVPVGTAPGGGSPRRVREALLHTVWVELEGRAVQPGDGTLDLEVCALDAGSAGVHARTHVRIRQEKPRAVLSAYLAFDASPAACGGAVRNALDALSRWVSSLPRGPRAVWAHGSAPSSGTLREGCAVMGPAGLSGDSRFRELSRRLRTGGLDRLVLVPPGSLPARNRDEVLELLTVHAGRFSPAAVEIVLSVGTALLADGAVDDLVQCVASLGRDARVVHAFVAGHGWVPSLVDATPWEIAGNSPSARDAGTLRARGRVDPGEALCVLLAEEASVRHAPSLGTFVRTALEAGRGLYVRSDRGGNAGGR